MYVWMIVSIVLYCMFCVEPPRKRDGSSSTKLVWLIKGNCRCLDDRQLSVCDHLCGQKLHVFSIKQPSHQFRESHSPSWTFIYIRSIISADRFNTFESEPSVLYIRIKYLKWSQINWIRFSNCSCYFIVSDAYLFNQHMFSCWVYSYIYHAMFN